MSPVARLVMASLVPVAVAGIAVAVRPSATSVLVIAAVVAMSIALISGWFTAALQADLGVMLKRAVIAVFVRLVLTGTAVVVLTRAAPEHALTVALVLAGGVAAAVLCEAFLLIPQRESARA